MHRSHHNDQPLRWLRAALMLGTIAVVRTIERVLVAKPVADQASPTLSLAPKPIPTPSRRGPATADDADRTRRHGWRQVLLNTYKRIGDDRLLAVAAGVVFYGLLAIFPTIAAFVSLYGLVADSTTIGNHLSLLSGVLPGGALEIVQSQIDRIVANPGGSLSVAFMGSLGLALWSANAGMKAMIDALNVIEGLRERRGFIRLNAVSLALTLGAILFLLLAAGVVVALPLVLSVFGLEYIVGGVMRLGRWPALMVIVLVALAVLYRFGPNRDHPRWRWLSPGILFAAFAWLAGSAALSLYLSKFADYNATYGSLGAGIGLMMWMWLTTIVVLLGAALDIEIDKIRTAAPATAANPDRDQPG